MINTVAQNPGFLDQLVVSDEAILSLNSDVNTHNVIHYAPYVQGHPANHFVEFEGADSVKVWIGLTRAGVVLGPHFIQGNLNTIEYLRIIHYYVYTLLCDTEIFSQEQHQQTVYVVATRWSTSSHE